MRIGIVPVLTRFGGGIYQYSLTMTEALSILQKQGELNDEFVIFHRADNDAELSNFLKLNWQIFSLCPSKEISTTADNDLLRKLRLIVGKDRLKQMLGVIRYQVIPALRNKMIQFNPFYSNAIHYRPDLRRIFNSKGIDIMLYPEPNTMSFESGIPYIMAVHDLQHRLQPEFPEVSADGEWQKREYLFRNGAKFATEILVDSEVGKEDVLEFYGSYGVTPQKVKVLPFLPASYLSTDVPLGERKRVQVIYNLPDRYIFYPAQFWPHKNHLRIARALKVLKEESNLDVHVVFVGSYTGKIREQTFRKVMSTAHQLGIERQIHYLGYVPEGDMSALYAGAVGLVMPTFFGPTNIPVLEAWAFGCPVITSDIRGIREQVKDAGILVNPRSSEAIADGINRIWSDESLRCALVERGRQCLGSYTPDDFRRRLKEILEEAKTLL